MASPDPGLLHRLGLDVLTPALFLALLFDEVRRERINRLPALLGTAIAAGLIVLLPAGPARWARHSRLSSPCSGSGKL
ncbi:hypothetical protein [Streptomyces cyaneofuscatus]|uniref:hypothetical protein n=1 Tax=Streptomyces cyaneofuscatus TaxID=66883 RepID=UPI003658A730